jgi:hypothetical protein
MPTAPRRSLSALLALSATRQFREPRATEAPLKIIAPTTFHRRRCFQIRLPLVPKVPLGREPLRWTPFVRQPEPLLKV